jgi:mannose-6-phosphate isomerase
VEQTREILSRLGSDPLVDDLLDRLVDDASLPAVFEWLVDGGDDVAPLLTRVLELAPAAGGIEFETVLSLEKNYPGDAGILVSLLLNRVTVRRGEVVYLPSGNIHSYQHGLGIEVLAASDNVLRGGLTPKYVDVPELLKVLDFRPLPVPFLEPTRPVPGLSLFRPDVPDFELAVIAPSEAPDGTVAVPVASEFVALCTEGSVVIHGAKSEFTLPLGGSVYGTADESPFTVTGDGILYLAATNPAA